MTTVLCCIAGHRSASPIALSEQPRNIRLARPEEIELNRIFLTACLPEDHPHAIKTPGRKVSTNPNIVRSPSFGNKLRRQLSRHSLPRRKSLQSLRHSAPRLIHRRSKGVTEDLTIEQILVNEPHDQSQYDDDARSVLVLSRIASSRDDVMEGSGLSLPQPPHRSMILPSFEWLVPHIKECVNPQAIVTEQD